MGFLQKVRTVVLGQFNDLLDKAVDFNSIPVLKQYVRDLEDATSQARHQAAVAAAQVTTLTREKANAEQAVIADKKNAAAFLAQGNDKAAREVAARILDHQATVTTLDSQIEGAKRQSATLDTAVERMATKHNSILTRIRELETKDRGAKALSQATKSMKEANGIMGQGVDASVDDVARRIEERNDVANEEFNRTTAEMETPEDPTKAAQVDELLESLKEPVAAK